ncbi:hypothetical protein F5144DRAFT_594775 [Chaetomium tenue]|uniref:Uncharacterized protein n=1 Tax=Chaetomium tenue TaxID=1854479 RepID=A0ACB7P6N1_9PEZI|nr:hypothetical protein F5144DRAFT_594775 [Chaetomium globosum]
MADSSTLYQKGARFRIRPHVPPEPFGGAYGPNTRPKISVWPNDVPGERVSFALQYPPMETAPPPSSGHVNEHEFTITGTKTLRRIGDDGSGPGGAHVVTGYLDHNRVTPYSVPAVASKAPEYHGTWTFPVATDQPGHQRWVRMILLQLVPGETVFDKILRASEDGPVRYDFLPDETFRLAVLKQTFEAEISIWWDAEVSHIDTEPRNVMVQPGGEVVLIDFNQAVVHRFEKYLQHAKYLEGSHHLPCSPIERRWPCVPGWDEFADHDGPWARWIPKSWLDNRELAAEWVLTTWGNPTPPNKYEPLSDYFLNHPAHKERGPRLITMLEKLGRKPAGEE